MRKDLFKIPNVDLLLEVYSDDSGGINQTRIKDFKSKQKNLKVKPISDINFKVSNVSGLTDFQVKVYKTLIKVPEGRVLTYKALAEKMGNPKAARAIGSAMRRNPVPYLIPCHRVVRGDGVIGQFSAQGGAKTKALLLESEGISLSHDGRIV